MARQNDGSYIKIKSITSWIQNLEEDIPEIYFGNELVFREWEIYKGTLPVLLETTKEKLYHYKIYGNDGGVGIKTEQLFSTTNSEGGYLDADGSVVSPQHANLRHTDFLPLPLDTSDITVSYEGPSGTGMNAPALCFYDSNKTYLAGEPYDGARTKTFTVPENAEYFRTSYRSTMTSVNIVAGTAPITSDIPYGYKLPILSNDTATDIYIGNTQLAKDEYVDSEKMKIYKRTENLFDESTIEVGGLSPSTGAEVINNTRRRSGFILVEPSTNYGLSREITSSGSHFWVIAYDENKNIVTDATIDVSHSGILIAGTTLTVNQWSFTTTPTTRYIRWYVTYNNSYKNIMLNLGSAPLPYEPYLAPTDPPVSFPQIPTAVGKTIIEYNGEGAQPEKVELKYFGEEGYSIGSYEGSLPVALETKEGNLVEYQIWGNTEQIGTPTPENPIVPSGCGERTRNLFDASDYSVGATSFITKRITLEPNTAYTMSSNCPLYNVGALIAIGNIGESFTTVKNGVYPNHPITRTTDANGKLVIGLRTNGSDYAPADYETMLNSGSTPLPYEPYGYKLPIISNDAVTDIYIGDTQLAKDEYVDSSTGKIYKWADITGLSEPLCGIDTHADELALSTGVLTRRIRKFELTGGENITLYTTATGNLFRTELPALRALGQFANAGMCTHYRVVANAADRVDGTISGGGTVGVQKFVDIVDNYATADDFKSYLAAQYTAGTPVTIWYVLAEPEISTIPVPSGLTGTIEGYLIQDGTPTPEAPIYPSTNGVKQEDGTYSIESAYLAPTDPPVSLPQIPTVAGETTISYGGTGAQPEKVELKYFGEGGYSIGSYEGLLPVTLETKEGNLVEYQIWGNTEQRGTPTPENPIVPSGCGERTRNLFDKNNTEGIENNCYISQDTGNIVAHVQYYIAAPIAVTSGETYYWVFHLTSGRVTPSMPTVGFFDANDNQIGVASHRKSSPIFSFIPPANCAYIRASVYKPDINEAMLVKSSTTPTSYVPYGYKLPLTANGVEYPIYLGESQTTRRIKKLLFDGTENWAYDSINTRLSSLLRGMDYKGARVTTFICSHYEVIDDGRTIYNVPNNAAYAGGTVGNPLCYIKTDEYSNADDFKSYLAAQYAAGTPVTVWYVLAKPETGIVNEPLMKIGDYSDTIDSTQTTAQIPTFAGETIVDYGIAALPYPEGLDGIFEYGNIDGLTWKNSVSGENDITFDTAVTDTGAEYVLPAGASGQYTSKSGEYRTAFTWYCVAKCPTTCHSAGQYMISNLGNGIGVEISSGWGAYTSVGGNHLVRGVDNRDYNSQMPVTDYALIVVSGDVNGVASVYVNGEKKTDSWNFNPVSSDRAVYLGKRASGQLSGTDIDYKFLALGTVKQTDEEILKNSEYLMKKYLGITTSNFPEKVKFKYRTN